MGSVELVTQLNEIHCFKFGKFTLKSGVISPMYVDLRVIISHPKVLKSISQKFKKVIDASNMTPDVICGVPYTALPIASAMSVMYDLPMIMKRKEAKNYGTKKILEGEFSAGQKCLIIEDVVTTGSSILEIVKELRASGLVVTDCLAVLDRQEGGEQKLKEQGVTLHSLLKIKDVINTLVQSNIISADVLVEVEQYFLKSKQKQTKGIESFSLFKCEPSSIINPVLRSLHHAITTKKTNLCVAVDVRSKSELLKIAELVGPYICILKTHIDILQDFDDTVVKSLQDIAKFHDFLIMEDRKFADIGSTSVQQYEGGIYKIKEWADIVTVHGLPGARAIEALKDSAKHRACVLVAEMSSEGTLTSSAYSDEIIKIAEKHSDFVIGFVCQSRLKNVENGQFIYMSPGVHADSKKDNQGQQYRTIEDAICRDNIDIIIVGRGIIQMTDVSDTAGMYKTKSFSALNLE